MHAPEDHCGVVPCTPWWPRRFRLSALHVSNIDIDAGLLAGIDCSGLFLGILLPRAGRKKTCVGRGCSTYIIQGKGDTLAQKSCKGQAPLLTVCCQSTHFLGRPQQPSDLIVVVAECPQMAVHVHFLAGVASSPLFFSLHGSVQLSSQEREQTCALEVVASMDSM
eukprot:1151836-Pelagomonas_calceolata.AAC.2